MNQIKKDETDVKNKQDAEKYRCSCNAQKALVNEVQNYYAILLQDKGISSLFYTGLHTRKTRFLHMFIKHV